MKEGSQPRDVLLVLVHGTWAKRNRHFRSGSELEKSIIEELIKLEPGRNVKSLGFTWSGKNNFKARHCATIKLRRVLRNYVRTNPYTVICLMGHSHGGSVAIPLLRDKVLGPRILKVVCLNTPVLHVSEDIGIFANSRALDMAPLFVIFALGWYFSREISIATHASTLVPLVVSVILTAMMARGLERMIEHGYSRSLSIIRRQNKVFCEQENVVFLRTTGDEIKGVLANSALITKAPYRITSPFAFLAAWPSSFFVKYTVVSRWPGLLWFRLVGVAGIVSLLGYWSSRDPSVATCLFAVGLLCFAVLFPGVVVFPALLIRSIVYLFSFGLDAALGAPFMVISSEQVLEGQNVTYLLAKQGHQIYSGINHSSLMEDSYFPASLANLFINGTFNWPR